ncbi:hypothetical protein HanIR_Chr02g0085811 [Helianthus annuus]|nr:hypothetical protein HanIR_Chr02g0085811 [Helianthus annuus]
MQQKAATLSNYRRHAVSLVYRTITHTAYRFFYIPLKIGKNICLHTIRGYNTFPHYPRAHVEYAEMTHTSPFRCVRYSELALFFGLNRISEIGKPHCLHSLQASNPSCPVHNRRGYMNTFFNLKKEGNVRTRTSATLTPEPSRATSEQHTRFERIWECKTADTHESLRT